MSTAALALLVLLYPLAVYFGLSYLPARWVGLGIAALFAVRLLVLLHGRTALARQLAPAIALGIACALLSALLNHEGTLRLLPVVINAASLVAFALTLRHGPSMIERFARLVDPAMDAVGVAYTRKVTAVWCGFFALNGLVSLYTALYASLALWTLYNGLLAYLLMGLLFAIEYAVRQRVRQKRSPP